MKKLITYSVLVFALVAMLGVSLHSQPAKVQDQSEAMHEKMMERHKEMTAMHQKMQAEMKAQDDELQKLVDQMNSAPADQKITAITAVVNKLVEQRIAMHQKMQSMMGGMMRQMMDMEDAHQGEAGETRNNDKHSEHH